MIFKFNINKLLAATSLLLVACDAEGVRGEKRDAGTAEGSAGDDAEAREDRSERSEDGDAGQATAAPLYVGATWVTSGDTTSTFVATLKDLDIKELDLSDAVEVGGYGDAWVYDEWIFVSDGESPVVTRYLLDEDDALVEDETVSFAKYGDPSVAFWNQQILSRDKAYLAIAAEEKYAVWSPEKMEITGEVDWPSLDFEDGLVPYHSFTDRGGVVTDGLLFHGLYGKNDDWDNFGDKSYVAVIDIETDTLQELIEVPCPMMDVASLSDDGYLYVSAWSYVPLSVTLGRSEENCAARIDVAKRSLDTSWSYEFGENTEGDQGSALRAVTESEGVFAVFHGSGVDMTDETDIWAIDAADDDWELYSLDLESLEPSPTGITLGSGSFYESRDGEDYFLLLPQTETTRVYQRDDSGEYQPRLQVNG